MTSPKLEDLIQSAEVRGWPSLGRGNEAVDSTVPSESDAALLGMPARFETNERPEGFSTVRPVRDEAPSNEYASM